MPAYRGYCLAIGLNQVATNGPAYQGSDIPALKGCVNDANAIAQMVGNLPNYAFSTVLTDDQATHDRVLGEISNAANQLKPGDFFLLHYSGHGMLGAVGGDSRPDPDSPANSSWVLYDRPLASDELYQEWFKFQPHIRVLVLSDSCHSGSAIRDVNPPYRERGLDQATRLRVLTNNLGYFQARDASLRALTSTAAAPAANVVLISGCQESETSLDTVDGRNVPHGLFTATVLEVMGGGFAGDYNAFYNEVRQRTDARSQQIAAGHRQNPNYLWVGGNYFELGMFGRLSPPFGV